MSVPKNNLADLLKRKANNALNPVHTYTPSPRSNSGKPKFKPAISTPTAGSSSKPANSLQSFSTPGFKQIKPLPLQTAPPETSNNVEPIDISDHSNPTSPNPLKRTSSDPDVVSEFSPKANKRPKKTATGPDKENLLGGPRIDQKVKSSSFISRIVEKAADSSSTTTDPSKANNTSDPRWMEAHSDLLDLSPKSLQSFRNNHHELLTHVMQLLLDGGTGSNDIVDSKVLQKLRKELGQRIEAIKWVEAQRQGTRDRPQAFPITPPLDCVPSSRAASMLMDSLATENAFPKPVTRGAISSIDPRKHPMVIKVDQGPSPETQSHAHALDSDEELWDSFGEMPVAVVDSFGRNTTHSSTALANRLHSPYHNEILRQLRDVFGLADFRENQLEAITATMDGKDVFVLMPTGGGKSLCYQLPAVCTTGRTHGVTIVVSPLTALMEDQVSALTARGIDAFFWSAETPQHEANAKLWNGDKKPSLLYITPEKLRASPACRNLLEKLYRQKQLARFAIDEAHCISTWGQDFRNAYQGLGQLRGDYPDVPIIALTATANQRTREDIINQLQLRNPAKFIQSFNRPNLKYVIKRKKNVLADIVDFINTDHRGHSGVIYCLSRKSCEQVAGQLREKGIAAEFFHAGLTKEEKNRLLEDWKADKFRTIVATIAFGMGIDKADVRFVIHYDLPKCLSGYYQETGRAGRDGKPADCVLYYAFKDFKTICWMIENSNDREEPVTPEAIQRQKDAAREVVKYCANISECRRVQVLRHFGQDFDERNCRRGCDNCLDDRQTVVEDVTAVATSIIDVIQAISSTKGKITLPQLTGVLRGSNAADIRNRGWAGIAGFGTCKSLSKELVELALDRLLDLKILLLTTQRQHNDFHHEYVEIGPAIVTFKEQGDPLCIEWKPPAKVNKVTKQNQERQVKGKGRAHTTTDDDPIECFPDENDSLGLGGDSSTGTPSSLSPTVIETFPASMLELYSKLDKFRSQIMAQEGLTSKASVMSEALLQSICYACPQDYHEFNRIVDEAVDEHTPFFSRCRHRVLDICLHHQVETTRKGPPLGVDEMHSRFTYHPSTSRLP